MAMLSLSIILLVGGSLVASNIAQQAETEVASDPLSAVARSMGNRHEVSLSGGTLPVEGTLLAITADGTASRVQLNWYYSRGLVDQSWDVGEWLCVSGPHRDCPRGAANQVSVSIQGKGRAPIQLGVLGDGSHVNPDVVNIVSKRAPFYIDINGKVVVQDAAHVHMQIIGTEITWGPTGPVIPVTVRATSDGGASLIDPFGGPAARGMVYDMGTLPEGAVLGAEARASYGTWSMTRASYSDDPFVRTLRHGDPVPSTPAYSGQVPVSSLLAPYQSEGFIQLEPDEVLLLFELGTSNMNSPAADFQDAVVLFTFDPEPLPSIAAPPPIHRLVCFAGVTFRIDPGHQAAWDHAGATPGECHRSPSELAKEELAFMVAWHMFARDGGEASDVLRIHENTVRLEVCHLVHAGAQHAHDHQMMLKTMPKKILMGHYAIGGCQETDYSEWGPESGLQGALSVMAQDLSITYDPHELEELAALPPAFVPPGQAKEHPVAQLAKQADQAAAAARAAEAQAQAKPLDAAAKEHAAALREVAKEATSEFKNALKGR